MIVENVVSVMTASMFQRMQMLILLEQVLQIVNFFGISHLDFTKFVLFGVKRWRRF